MADYYISLTGDDGTGDGSTGTPWATPEHAAQNATDGDTIYVGGGTWSNDADYTWNFNSAANHGKTLNFEAWPGTGTVLLDDSAWTASRKSLVRVSNEPASVVVYTFKNMTFEFDNAVTAAWDALIAMDSDNVQVILDTCVIHIDAGVGANNVLFFFGSTLKTIRSIRCIDCTITNDSAVIAGFSYINGGLLFSCESCTFSLATEGILDFYNGTTVTTANFDNCSGTVGQIILSSTGTITNLSITNGCNFTTGASDAIEVATTGTLTISDSTIAATGWIVDSEVTTMTVTNSTLSTSAVNSKILDIDTSITDLTIDNSTITTKILFDLAAATNVTITDSTITAGTANQAITSAGTIANLTINDSSLSAGTFLSAGTVTNLSCSNVTFTSTWNFNFLIATTLTTAVFTDCIWNVAATVVGINATNTGTFTVSGGTIACTTVAAIGAFYQPQANGSQGDISFNGVNFTGSLTATDGHYVVDLTALISPRFNSLSSVSITDCTGELSGGLLDIGSMPAGQSTATITVTGNDITWNNIASIAVKVGKDNTDASGEATISDITITDNSFANGSSSPVGTHCILVGHFSSNGEVARNFLKGADWQLVVKGDDYYCHHNRIYGWRAYLDLGARNRAEHNSIYSTGTTEAAFRHAINFRSTAVNGTFRNNIVVFDTTSNAAGGENYKLMDIQHNMTGTNFLCDYNCYYHIAGPANSYLWEDHLNNTGNTLSGLRDIWSGLYGLDNDTHSVYGDALLDDPESDDFSLGDNSPALMAGYPGPCTDIGCYQYSPSNCDDIVSSITITGVRENDGNVPLSERAKFKSNETTIVMTNMKKVPFSL